MTPSQPSPESIRQHHEGASVRARLIVIAVIGFFLVVFLSLFIVRGVDRLLGRHQTGAVVPARQSPAPERGAALEPDQRQRKQAYMAEQQQLLNTYGWVDRQQGIAHIPIEDAMRIYVKEHEAHQ
jgi:hypothetical protein